MKYRDLREFIPIAGATWTAETHPAGDRSHLEMTEIADRTLRAQGPALLFENPKGSRYPVLANLFGTPERVAWGMGQNTSARCAMSANGWRC